MPLFFIIFGILFILSIVFFRNFYLRNKDHYKNNGIFKIPDDKYKNVIFPPLLIIFLTLMVGGFMLFDVGGNNNDKSSKSSNCNYAYSIEQVRSCGVGTWIATPSGDLWNRVILKNDQSYELYSTTPSSGSWGSVDKTGTYSINEARYSDTGKSYVYVSLKDSGLCRYKIVFDGKGAALECNGNYNIIRKGDRNPWD